MSISGLSGVASTLVNVSMPSGETRGSSSETDVLSGPPAARDEIAGRQNTQVKTTDRDASAAPAPKFSPAVLSVLQEEQEVDADTAVYKVNTQADRAGPNVRNVNGTDVVVSGHSLDAEEGVSRFRTFSGQMKYSPEVQAQLTSDTPPTLDIEYGKAFSGRPAGMTSYYMSVEVAKLEGEWSQGSSDARLDQIDRLKQQDVDRFLDLLDVERTLKSEYGEDVKLAYSHKDDGYIMLTPDDPNYDNIASVEENLETMLQNIRSGANYGQGYIDGLRSHGYNV